MMTYGKKPRNAVPEVVMNRIELAKQAFEECSSLRTVVALAKNIKFTEIPFKDSPKDLLTFVCYEKSEVEQFARENGYRYVNV